MRVLLSILVLPLIFFYGKSFFLLFGMISLADPFQLWFFIAFAGAAVLSFLFISSGSFLATFEHELTHNLFAILTFNKPTGFHVNRDGSGLFQYRGRGNILITLGPYFFQTFSFMILPLYLVIMPKYHVYFFVLLGILTGYHSSSTIKEFGFRQPDIRKNGILFSTILVLFLNIISFGILLAFVIGNWQGIGEFLVGGMRDLFEIVKVFLS